MDSSSHSIHVSSYHRNDDSSLPSSAKYSFAQPASRENARRPTPSDYPGSGSSSGKLRASSSKDDRPRSRAASATLTKSSAGSAHANGNGSGYQVSSPFDPNAAQLLLQQQQQYQQQILLQQQQQHQQFLLQQQQQQLQIQAAYQRTQSSNMAPSSSSVNSSSLNQSVYQHSEANSSSMPSSTIPNRQSSQQNGLHIVNHSKAIENHNDDSLANDLSVLSIDGVEKDIDKEDLGDEIMVAEYALDIYNYMFDKEIRDAVEPTYMSKQQDINARMRAITIDWLVEVHAEFRMMTDTLYLAVYIMDKYLSMSPQTNRRHLQLVGATSMMIASKVDEIYSPRVDDFVMLCDRAYTRDQVIQMESAILNKLTFQVTTATPMYFLRRFIKAADGDTRLKHMSCYFMELMLLNVGMLRYMPSQIAAVALYMALRITHGTPQWSAHLQFHTRYSEGALSSSVVDLTEILNNLDKSSLKAVRVKYRSSKFSEVAKRIVHTRKE